MRHVLLLILSMAFSHITLAQTRGGDGGIMRVGEVAGSAGVLRSAGSAGVVGSAGAVGPRAVAFGAEGMAKDGKVGEVAGSAGAARAVADTGRIMGSAVGPRAVAFGAEGMAKDGKIGEVAGSAGAGAARAVADTGRLKLANGLSNAPFTPDTQNDIEAKMARYAKAKPSANLFVHFDKNVYTNSETVYFTAYLLKPGQVPLYQHQVLSVALIRDIDSTLVLEDKFAMEEGISFGSISLPDSILSGDYHFMAYTEYFVNEMPDVLFRQNITLKSTLDPKFRAEIKLLSPQPDTQHHYQVLLRASTADGRFMPKPLDVTYRYGTVTKNAKTDASSQALLLLPANRPGTDPKLYVKIKSGKDSTFLQLELPAQQKAQAQVKFYPEGGSLVEGLPAVVGWEVKDPQNRPLSLKAFLYKDGKVIDTIESSRYGLGRFNLLPQKGAQYSVRLVHSAFADSLYTLPSAAAFGMTMQLANALAVDTLILQLYTREKQNISLLLHNFNECFIHVPYRMERGAMRMKIVLDEVPKGLATLTLLDSLGRPLAERLFFAHYDPRPEISIQPDKAIYQKREAVNLRLQLQNESNAQVSVAVTQAGRHEQRKSNDVESYTYITHQLGDLPLLVDGRVYTQSDYLSQVLLVKGWRRYTWQDMIKTSDSDTLFNVKTLRIQGDVRQEKIRSGPFQIGLLGDVHFQLFDTDNNGHIVFNTSKLLGPANKKMLLFINGINNYPGSPKLYLKDDFSRFNAQAAKLPDETPIAPSELFNNTTLLIPNNEKVLRLQEVVIRGKTDKLSGARGANACGDYVCPYNILNCPNHINDPFNVPPQAGYTYLSNGTRIVYKGCNPVDDRIFTQVMGLHEAKEFYSDDYKDPNEPAFFSTLYWTYSTVISSGQNQTLRFYTGDIAGRFRVIVQGVSDTGIVYGESSFEVK